MFGYFGRRLNCGIILVLVVFLGFCGGLVLVVLMLSRGFRPEERAAAFQSRVTIESVPESGAEVTIRGRPRGQTPVTVEGLPPGETLVVLTKERYNRTTRFLHATEAENQRFVIELEGQVGFVSFVSKPAGAQVFVDGDTYLGEAPITDHKMRVGVHAYELRLEDYRPVTSTVKVEPDYRYKRVHELKPKSAHLTVLSRPTNARIWLNDELATEVTPAKLALMPGAYTIALYVKGYVRAEETTSLGPNQELTVEMELKQGDVPPGMVLVPGGKFIMGCNEVPDERPQREIEVDAFYIDKYEATNKEFKAVFPQHTYEKIKENLPVVGVSYNRACEYARAVGKRLPTEAEWEKAARGVDGREYPWGGTFDRNRCVSLERGTDSPMQVGACRTGASPYGCMDMAGNAYEWTADWYQAYPGNPDVKKDYGQVFRVLRGGSYQSDRFGVRCSRRHYDRMDGVRADYGLRCVKDVESAMEKP